MITETWAKEIRDYLLGRLGTSSQLGAITPRTSALPTPKIRDWWILVGKRYVGLEAGLANELPRVHRLATALLASFNPTWRTTAAPHGEIDWVATARERATSPMPTYVIRSANVGLSAEERDALLGWMDWIRGRYASYFAAVHQTAPALPDWAHLVTSEPQLARWARTARRSRWPLMRNIVAESLRCLVEHDELDRLPLPTAHQDLFELAVLVRLLRHLDPGPTQIQWLDHKTGNMVRTQSLTARFQHDLKPEVTLDAGLFPRETAAAMRAHGIDPPRRSDLVIRFATPRAGFAGILVECKSGDVRPHDAIYQLMVYRSALRKTEPEPFVVWGVTESQVSRSSAARIGDGDHWIFSDLENIALVLGELGLLSET